MRCDGGGTRQNDLSFYRCVDFAVKIRVNPQQTGIDTNVKHSMVRQQSSFCFELKTHNKYMLFFSRTFHLSTIMMIMTNQNRTLSTRLVRNDASLPPFPGNEM